MYSRYQNYRFGTGVSVPRNYSGNAFSESLGETQDYIQGEAIAEDIAQQEEIQDSEHPVLPQDESDLFASSDAEEDSGEAIAAIKEDTHRAQKKKGLFDLPFKFNIGKLFSGGFGSEELLILALIFLILQSGDADEIILLLALLLFVG
jgi:hypothetical protein